MVRHSLYLLVLTTILTSLATLGRAQTLPDFGTGRNEHVEYAGRHECADEGWFDNLSLFVGLDGAKQPQDLGINANIGPRLAVNWGLPLLPDLGLGLQLGAAYVSAQNAVNVLHQVDDTSGRDQFFTTVGAFQKFDNGMNWSLVWDHLSQNYYDNFSLSQFRGRVGWQFHEKNETGFWFALHLSNDTGLAGGVPVQLQSLNQISWFWRHEYETGAQTNIWIGAAESHSEVVYVFPSNATSGVTPVLGSSIYVPLNDLFAIYGEANLVLPSNTGCVDAFLGIAYYPGGGAQRTWWNRFAPLLPVAGSPSFAVDMRR